MRLRPHLNGRALVLLFTLTVARLWHRPATMLDGSGTWATAAIAATASLPINNLPAAAAVLPQPNAHPVALLPGLDLGPNLTVTGSLSAVLWLQASRSLETHTSLATYTRHGALPVPATLLVTLAALVTLGS